MDSCDSHGRSRQHDRIDQMQIFMDGVCINYDL